MSTGIVNIHGRQYQTVGLRMHLFREKFPLHSLVTEMVQRDDITVVMKASILDEQGRVLATGHAEEVRTSSQVNETSALENAETSAIGRALAALGIGGTEYASADEVQNAIHQRETRPAAARRAQAPSKAAAKAPTGSPLDEVLARLTHEFGEGAPWEGQKGAVLKAIFGTSYIRNIRAMSDEEVQSMLSGGKLDKAVAAQVGGPPVRDDDEPPPISDDDLPF